MPIPRGLARWAAVLVLLGVLMVPAVAWAQPPGVVAENTVDGRARLVVSGTGPIAVAVDGRPQPITTTPLVSDRSAMTLVVDASAEGGPGLQAGLGGLVDFALAAPPTTRTVLVTDTSPPAVAAALQSGPAGVLTGLRDITARGERQTVAALDLAVAQLPREPDSPRLVVLYTSGAGTAEAADDLAARLRADGVVLAVVTTADDGYWGAVAAGTGGVAVAARQVGVFDAFGQVASALRTRSLVTLPAPEKAPSPAVVRVGGQSVDTALPPARTGVDPVIVGAGVVLGVVVLALAVVAVAHWMRPVRHAHEWAAAPMVERGRRRRRRRPVWNIPDQAAAPTVARRRVRAAIEYALATVGPVAVRPADGRAGVGVTTAMVEFAHHYREAYDVAWWIAARDPQLVGDQMARLAEALGVAASTDPADAAAAAALAALRQGGRWLLIFDDAGSRHDLARFLPEGTGHVLVGATDPAWVARSVVVSPFTRAESVELLRARCDGLSAADADRVAAALADVPLDVAVAGATLATSGLSADALLAAVADGAPEATGAGPDVRRSNEPEATAAPEAGAGSDPPAPTAAAANVPGPDVQRTTEPSSTAPAEHPSAVWDVAFDRLAADDPPALALLTVVAWLGPEPVPTDLLTAHADHLPARLATADPAQLVATLGRSGLARVDGESLLLHQVPATHLVRRTSDERPDDAGWATWAVRLLRAAAPPHPDDPTSWPTWRRLLPHVVAATDPGRPLDDVAVEVGWLLHQAAGFLRARGQQESARALLEDAHDLYRRRLGPDHPETCAAAHALADNLRALGRPDQAQRVLEDRRDRREGGLAASE